MQNAVNQLRDQFLTAPPPGLDEMKMTRREAERVLAVVGIGGIVTIHDELQDRMYQPLKQSSREREQPLGILATSFPTTNEA